MGFCDAVEKKDGLIWFGIGKLLYIWEWGEGVVSSRRTLSPLLIAEW